MIRALRAVTGASAAVAAAVVALERGQTTARLGALKGQACNFGRSLSRNLALEIQLNPSTHPFRVVQAPNISQMDAPIQAQASHWRSRRALECDLWNRNVSRIDLNFVSVVLAGALSSLRSVQPPTGSLSAQQSSTPSRNCAMSTHLRLRAHCTWFSCAHAPGRCSVCEAAGNELYEQWRE